MRLRRAQWGRILTVAMAASVALAALALLLRSRPQPRELGAVAPNPVAQAPADATRPWKEVMDLRDVWRDWVEREGALVGARRAVDDLLVSHHGVPVGWDPPWGLGFADLRSAGLGGTDAAHLETLITYARRSDEARRKTIGLIEAAIQQYLTEFPPRQDAGARWEPTVIDPGGLWALEFVLAELDATEALPLLVAIFDRDQEVARALLLQLGIDPLPEGQRIYSPHIHMLASACDRLLRRRAEDPRVREGLSPGQRSVADDFATFRSEALAQARSDWHGATPLTAAKAFGFDFHLQYAVMDFARQFCESAAPEQ